MKNLNKKIQSLLYFIIFSVCFIMIKCQANTTNYSVSIQMINNFNTSGRFVGYKVYGEYINNPITYQQFEDDLYFRQSPVRKLYFSEYGRGKTPYLYILAKGSETYAQCVIDLLGPDSAFLNSHYSSSRCKLEKQGDIYQFILSGNLAVN